MLEAFWGDHNPCAPAWSRQYRSAVFYHDDEQKRLVEETRERVEEKRGSPVQTAVEAAGRFYLAEDYHQKYRLRQVSGLAAEFERIYPNLRDFVDSTAVTRANAYLAGYGSRVRLEKEIDGYGLSEAARQWLITSAR